MDPMGFEPEKSTGPVLEDQHRFSPGETWLQLVLPCLPRGRLMNHPMFIACAILIYTIYIYMYTYIYICIYIYVYICISLSTKMRCYTSALVRPGHGCLTFRSFERGQSSAEPPRTRLRSLLESFSAALNMNRRAKRIWCCHFLGFL